MKGPPLGPGGEDITWPEQVALRGRRTSSTRNLKRQTSNLSGAGPLDPHPSGERCVLLARVAPIVSPLFSALVAFSLTVPDYPVRVSATFPTSRPYWPTCVMAREHSASKPPWPSKDATTRTPAGAWRGGCSVCVHRMPSSRP